MFDPEYTITLYFNGDEALTQADVDQLSEWIEKSHENAVKFIQASFTHRATYDLLVGADINKNVLLDLREATNSGYEVVMDSNVPLDGIDVRTDVLSDKKEDTFADYELYQDDNIKQALLEAAEFARTAPEVIIDKPSMEPVVPEIAQPIKIEHELSKMSKLTLIFSAAAVLLFIAIVFFSPVQPIVAILSDSVDAEWANTEDVPVKWDSLRQGELTLARGLAEITFADGAVVVVEGPAIFNLENPKNMFLTRGKISVIVSKRATGFEVNTLSARIIDLGTEFGVNVEGEGLCSLHMFKGKASLVVGAKDSDKSSYILSENHALQVDFDSLKVSEIAMDKDVFVRRLPSPYERTVLKSQPYVYWGFENNSSGLAMNSIDESRYNGSFLGNSTLKEAGPDLGDGESNTALLLDGQDSYVKFENVVRKSTGNYSIVLWVRPNSDEAQNIIASSDQSGPELNFSSQLRVGIDKRFEFYNLSKTFKSGGNKGKFRLRADDTVQVDRWYFLAVTIDQRNEIRFYVNGELVDSTTMNDRSFDSYPDIYVGSAAGNKRGYPEHKMGSFNGVIDDIAIFDRCLDENKIKSIFNCTQKE